MIFSLGVEMGTYALPFIYIGDKGAALQREANDIHFEVITPRRGPVRSGAYLTIAPPFTVRRVLHSGVCSSSLSLHTA